MQFAQIQTHTNKSRVVALVPIYSEHAHRSCDPDADVPANQFQIGRQIQFYAPHFDEK